MHTNVKALDNEPRKLPLFYRFAPQWLINGYLRTLCLLDWLPIIWNDCDWDQGYLLIIMEKKLDRMHKFFTGPLPNIADAESVANEIAEVRDAIRRLKADDYALPELMKYYEQTDIPRGPLSPDHWALLLKSIAHEDAQRARDEEIAFTGIKRYYRGWWD